MILTVAHIAAITIVILLAFLCLACLARRASFNRYPLEDTPPASWISRMEGGE